MLLFRPVVYAIQLTNTMYIHRPCRTRHFNGNPNAPMMIFETLVSEDNTVPWEGTIPSNESSNPNPNPNANLQGDACADSTSTSRVATHHIPGIDDSVVAGVEAAGFQPLPVKKGDLVLIHGQVDHLSLPNVSGKSRHTFQLHLVRTCVHRMHACMRGDGV